jgi:predicted GH43/DUF377 family glycosyl hydrolase
MFVRSKNNPILKPNKDCLWESRKVYNCGAIYYKNKYHLFYRAVGKDWHSSIGYAGSSDGEHFKRFDQPILFPEGEQEKRGLEDPRITKINSTYFITYAVYNGTKVTLQSATSRNLRNWKKHGEMIPVWNFVKADGFLVEWDPAQVEAQKDATAKKKWAKAGGIFPEIINNKYWMLFGDRNIWLANSQDGIHWQPIWKPFIKPRRGNYFDNIHVEMGPPPIRTKKGWLVLYHGINDKIVYRIGFLILDLKNPTKILFRSEKPIFGPEEPYELGGLVDILPGGLASMETMSKEELNNYIIKLKEDKNMPCVVFCCGAVVVNNILRIYYGASDSAICTATTKLNTILNIYPKK